MKRITEEKTVFRNELQGNAVYVKGVDDFEDDITDFYLIHEAQLHCLELVDSDRNIITLTVDMLERGLIEIEVLEIPEKMKKKKTLHPLDDFWEDH
jgi:hypothetical protein